MDRLTLISQLENAEHNIRSIYSKINAIEQSAYYNYFGHKKEQEHSICIQEKCLAFWKRKFNSITNQLIYKS